MGDRVATPDGVRPAAVAVSGAAITAVTAPEDAPDARTRVVLGNAALLPGVVDVHVHVNEPGRADWEGFATATRAAAAGGVTTLVDMPLNSVPATTTADALRDKARCAAGAAWVDYGFWGGAVPGNAKDLTALLAEGALGFKCFLVPSGVPEFAPLDRAQLLAAMSRLADLGALLLVHAELPQPIASAERAAAGGDPRRHATWLAHRPPEAELRAIEQVLELARRTGCRAHVVHLSGAGGVAPIVAARGAGVAVSVETCPHYLTFAAEDVPDGATEFKCAPPIRERANRESLWDALAAGGIDLVASDHSPCPAALKRREAGDFLGAWGGIASLQLLLAATWTGARERGHGLGALARWLADAPARLAGIDDRKGRIAPGHDADLVVFEPEASWTVVAERLHHRHPVTPYAGRALSGRVTRTYVRGRCVFDDGHFPSPPCGSWIKPSAELGARSAER